MFQKESMIKQYIFMFVDICMLTIALLVSNLLRYHRLDLFRFQNLYLLTYYLSVAACLISNAFLQLNHKIFDRGIYQELIAVMKSSISIAIVILTYLYLSQRAIDYSRLQLSYFIIFYTLFDYIGHLAVKKYISTTYRKTRSCRKIMLITTSNRVQEILEKLKKTNNWYFELAYITLLDVDRTGEQIENIPIIGTKTNMLQNSREIALDGVFINVSYTAGFDVHWALREFMSMGVSVHVNIDALELDMSQKIIENLGFFKVVSYTNTLRDPIQMILKKMMDKLGAMIGLFLTLLVCIVLVPAIKLDSPGPVIFAQTRVGKNGRKFRMYKFRSMYLDAEARKAELQGQNEMSGAMFKMTDDPRITKVGKFIRKYSIDELPQFYNVLIGDMSLVGTRPPTVDEVEQYAVNQKRRLSVTPGMTGVWQTSGRSEIYDFDEIVKLDLEYIDKWSIGLDLKLLFKTIIVCFRGSGAK